MHISNLFRVKFIGIVCEIVNKKTSFLNLSYISYNDDRWNSYTIRSYKEDLKITDFTNYIYRLPFNTIFEILLTSFEFLITNIDCIFIQNLYFF